MRCSLTMEYWEDAGGFVGRLMEVPGVFGQGDTVEELEVNLRDAYELLLAEDAGQSHSASSLTRLIEIKMPN